MIHGKHNGGWVIVVSIFVALMLTVWPLPGWARQFRPEWVAMVLIYWVLALPDRVGVGVCWTVGLLLDALTGTLLGEHALAMALVGFVALRIHLQVRVYPLWQQMLVMAGLLAGYEFILFWIDGITGYDSDLLTRWLPVAISALLWPWVVGILRDLRRRLQVT